MAEKHSEKHSWPARLAPVVAVVSTAATIVIGFLNYRLQRELQEESTAERILVRLDASRTINNKETLRNLLSAKPGAYYISTGDLSLDPIGEVGMEIVNIGLRPLFIKRADLRIGNQAFLFHEHDPFQLLPNNDPAKTNEATKLLEASEAIRYPLSLDFSYYPNSLLGSPAISFSKPADIEVQVQTTKKTFSCPHQFLNRIVWAAVATEGEHKFKVVMDDLQPGKQASPAPCVAL